jgi:uncharacterized membrane protein
MKQWPRRIALFLVLVAVFHAAAILAAPRVLMWLAMSKLEHLGGVGHIVHAPRADENSRRIVMPSPDLLYSYCVYDLAQGPLRVHAAIPPDTYWSLSAYDASTNNWYVVDDRGAGSNDVDLLVLAPDAAQPQAEPGLRVARSPSRRGLLLFRTLVDRDERGPSLDAARRQASCAPQP